MARPDDECPYPKPFPADFDACPAYQPRQFIPLDTLYQQRELGIAIAPYNARLWEVKGQQLRAIRDGRDASEATAELRRLAAQMTADLHTFLSENSHTFADIDMP